MFAREVASTLSMIDGPESVASAPAAKKKSSKKAAAEEPFDNTSYKSPEYYSHGKDTYAELMVTMDKMRLAQKSNQEKC